MWATLILQSDALLYYMFDVTITTVQLIHPDLSSAEAVGNRTRWYHSRYVPPMVYGAATQWLTPWIGTFVTSPMSG